MKLWGLTGGIASGKSTAARFFSEAGIPVLDADVIARELSAPGGMAHDVIASRFGTTDRAKLRELIFKDPAARAKLEGILHPIISAESQRRALATGAPVVIYEAALLVETGRYKNLAGLIVIESPLETRITRLMERDDSTREEAQAVINAQASDAQRRAAATWVLKNDGTPEDLRQKVVALVPKL